MEFKDSELISAAWISLARELNLPNDVQTRIGELILMRYQEAHRHYHTLRHIRELLEILESDEYVSKTIKDRHCVMLSIFFHDLVYQTIEGSPCNEEESALLFEREMAPFLPLHMVEKVAYYIRQTREHDVETESDLDLKLFIDIDMSILGREDPLAYDEYAGQIRREFIDIPKHIYCFKRAAFLRNWLSSGKRIFATSYFSEKLEAFAMRNMKKECDVLENGETISGE